MIFDDPTIRRLLGAIDANRLTLLCGAGLSIPSPSSLMSAIGVSQFCYDKYHAITALPPAMRNDVEQLASHFHGTHEFESVFLGSLVPWNDLVGEPNAGHAAVADFLISRAAEAVLSANFDTLIEQWAERHKIAMAGALNGREAMEFTKVSNPLVKFHGCLTRDRRKTLWAQAQLAERTIKDRVDSCSEWIKLVLPGKDLVVIGFWTDWGYLNDVLVHALGVTPFGSVTVINRESSAELKRKAPSLWATLTGGTATFLHLEASSAEALEELRVAFSRTWLRRFYALGKPLVTAAGMAYAPLDPAMSSEHLYESRCDAEGVPYNRAAQLKEPPAHAAEAAFFHHLMSRAGATRDGSWYTHGGRRVRVVQGAGQALNSVKEGYKEPPALGQPDIVACAGALDLPIPGKIIGTGTGLSVMRPSPGAGAQWMTLEQARVELGV